MTDMPPCVQKGPRITPQSSARALPAATAAARMRWDAIRASVGARDSVRVPVGLRSLPIIVSEGSIESMPWRARRGCRRNAIVGTGVSENDLAALEGVWAAQAWWKEMADKRA